LLTRVDTQGVVRLRDEDHVGKEARNTDAAKL
jgi:hypothetical protein